MHVAWGDPLTFPNVLHGIDDDSWRALDPNDFGCAVWTAAVINETRDAALLRGIHNFVVHHPEQIG